MADTTIRELGYEPLPRTVTAEENSISVLQAYELEGFGEANSLLKQLKTEPEQSIDRLLIAMHGIVAAMDWELIKLIQLLRLLIIAGDENIAALNTVDTLPLSYVA